MLIKIIMIILLWVCLENIYKLMVQQFIGCNMASREVPVQRQRYMLNLDSEEEMDRFENHVKDYIEGSSILKQFISNANVSSENVSEELVGIFERAAGNSHLMKREVYKCRDRSEIIDVAISRYANKRNGEDKAYKVVVKQLQSILESESKKHDVVSLENFVEHFKTLYSVDAEQQTAATNTGPESDGDGATNAASSNADELGREICALEVKEAIFHLEKHQTNVSCGLDGISNEYLICSRNVPNLVRIYQKLFNQILGNCDIPVSWCLGKIHPIYKDSGDRKDPKKYRGVVQFSCLGKLFTQILKVRLNKFLKRQAKICENQVSCRDDYEAIDHVFVLKSLVDIYRSKEKDLLCVFVDFEKAFDSVPRDKMLEKLKSANVRGKFLKVIREFYAKTKCCVSYRGELSESFQSLKGLPQGDRLSPILFNLYVNDMERYLLTHDCTRIKVVPGEASSDDMLLLQYADDTVILADSLNNLKTAVGALGEYCQEWGLKVNKDKTKFVPFTLNHSAENYGGSDIRYNGNLIEPSDEFEYLGVIFEADGSLKKCISHNVDLAESKEAKKTRDMLSLMKKKYSQDASIRKFSYKLISETLLRRSEIWGYESVEEIEEAFRRFLQLVAGVQTNRREFSSEVETAIQKLTVECNSKAEKLRQRVFKLEETRYAKIAFRRLKELHESNNLTSHWLEYAQMG